MDEIVFSYMFNGKYLRLQNQENPDSNIDNVSQREYEASL